MDLQTFTRITCIEENGIPKFLRIVGHRVWFSLVLGDPKCHHDLLWLWMEPYLKTGLLWVYVVYELTQMFISLIHQCMDVCSKEQSWHLAELSCGVRDLIEGKANSKSPNLTSPSRSLPLAWVVHQNKYHILWRIVMQLLIQTIK